MRYVERRLIGHPKLEAVVLPIFRLARPFVERPIVEAVPTMDKGQQQKELPPQRFTVEGLPIPIKDRSIAAESHGSDKTIYLQSAAEIQRAIASAAAGQRLEILPGTYSLDRSILIRASGRPQEPIILRASQPGNVVIEFNALEGFHLQAPNWVFENLVIRGTCKQHSNCEHAFHIVGKASNIVIRNNRIEDFNAQIKVNGLSGNWPDDGLIQFNTIHNNSKRNTSNPVTPIDIVAGSRWVVTDNVISNFIKAGGDQISYGAYMKGGGTQGRFERNIVICTLENVSQAGIRVGLSFGGGGTNINACRDGRCVTEHSEGVIAGNVIADCNDFGIYINKSNQTRIVDNILANTYGIDVRFPSASAYVEANTLDGLVRARDGAMIESKDNRTRRNVDIQSGRLH